MDVAQANNQNEQQGVELRSLGKQVKKKIGACIFFFFGGGACIWEKNKIFLFHRAGIPLGERAMVGT